MAPVIDLKRGGSSDERQIVDTPPHVAAGLKVSAVPGFLSAMRPLLLELSSDPVMQRAGHIQSLALLGTTPPGIAGVIQKPTRSW